MRYFMVNSRGLERAEGEARRADVVVVGAALDVAGVAAAVGIAAVGIAERRGGAAPPDGDRRVAELEPLPVAGAAGVGAAPPPCPRGGLFRRAGLRGHRGRRG